MILGISSKIIFLSYHHIKDKIIEKSSFFFKFELSDLINLVGIVANVLLAIWIVKNLQDKLNNKRTLKDHFINETKEIRNEYRAFLNDLNKGITLPKEIIPWFKTMNIKSKDLMTILNTKHNINKKLLNPYSKDLKKIVTEFETFNENYRQNSPIILDYTAKSVLMKFQQTNNHIFNDIIIAINDN